MEDRWGWAAAAAALLAPVGAALANWWKRSSDREQREGDWREKGNQALFDQQSAQLVAAYKRIADMEAERAQERAEFRAVEADRDLGWDLLRAWHERAHEERHEHINTLQILMKHDANAAERRIRPPLPHLREIKPKRKDSNGGGG